MHEHNTHLESKSKKKKKNSVFFINGWYWFILFPTYTLAGAGMPLHSSFENTGFVIDYKFSAILWPYLENVIYTF